ncbi:MAG: ABC-2 family transporter protein [Lachnospiraceae bacterium]|nr:ABC-2 family transporter protein [Lachnospiraceae bacterium]MBQ8548941.1 ABC-2 family transporter protein [Lachnospiraceae bacterium]
MSLRKSISLYIRYAAVCVRSIMEYKLSFGLMIFGRCMIAFTEFLAIRFLFDGLTEIKGYTYGDVLLCFSVIHMSFTLSELIGNGFKTFSGIVKSGEFDRMLLRPCSPILQIIGTRFEIGRTGPLITSTITLCLGIRESQVHWNFLTAFTLLLMILGGTLLFIGLYMLGASFCFFTIEDTSILNALTYGAKEHGKYPIDVYGRGVLRFCTFVIPYTLVQYYPLQFLLGRSTSWVLGLCPVGVVVFLAICYGVWCAGVRNYKSCGS